jgi:hypothetical protein
MLQQHSIVSDKDQRTPVIAQKVLQPRNRCDVEMVGRLIQQQQIGSLTNARANMACLRIPPEQLARRWSAGNPNRVKTVSTF